MSPQITKFNGQFYKTKNKLETYFYNKKEHQKTNITFLSKENHKE